jgi:hypothetical protein
MSSKHTAWFDRISSVRPLAVHSALLLGPALLLAGCCTCPQPICHAPAPQQAQGAAAADEPDGPSVKVCSGGLAPASGGLVSSFENGELTGMGDLSSSGTFRKDAAAGSTLELEVVSDGAAGTTHSLRVTGDASGGWGASVEAPLPGYPSDLSSLAGISFWAKSTSASVKRVELRFPDIDSWPDGQVCGEKCFNHFHYMIELGPEWKKHTVAFKDLVQKPGFGIIKPMLESSQVYKMQFAVQGKGVDFQLDEIEFLDCASTSAP